MPDFQMEKALILADILGKTKEWVLAHPEAKLSAKQKRKLKLAEKKIKRGEPLAYVLGWRWFFGRKFKVNRNVLIPRPETELLVELALAQARQAKPEVIADIGTGSGAIIVSLKSNLQKSRAGFFGTDISPKALAVAKQNAQGLKIKFKKGGLAKPLAKELAGKNVLITANLPYLSAKELREPSIKKEPRLALFGGSAAPHQKIGRLIAQIAAIRPHRADILLEINYNQAEQINRIIKKRLRDARTRIYKDLNGYDRVIFASVKNF